MDDIVKLLNSLGDGERFVLIAVLAVLVVAIAIGMAQSALRRREAGDRSEKIKGEAEEFLRRVYEEKKLPAVAVNIILKEGEVAIFDEPSTLLETRAYRIYGGGGTRIRGVYVGGGASESHQRLRQIDSGHLILTNQRLVFDGGHENRSTKLSDIISATTWSDAIEVSSGRRQKSQIYTVGNPIIWQQVIHMLASGKIQTVGEMQPAAAGTEKWSL